MPRAPLLLTFSLGILATAVLLIGSPATVRAAGDDRRQGEAEVGKVLPNIAALDSTGIAHSARSVLASDGGGNGLVLQFMTVDCPRCKDEIRELVAGKAALDAARVRVLVVNLMDEPERLGTTIKALGAEVFPVVRDRTGALVDLLKLQEPQPGGGVMISVPLSFVADRDGTLRRIYRGHTAGYVQEVLGALGLAGK